MTAISLHPEATAAEAVVRWVVPPGVLSFVGRIRQVPEPLAGMLHNGIVTEILVEPTAVRITLGEGRSWRAEGARVRSALAEALTQPDGWVPVAGTRPEDMLRAAVEEVIASEAGDYIRSHGGTVDLVGVSGNDVELTMGGPCQHCPLRGQTLHGRLETAIRERYPALRNINLTNDARLTQNLLLRVHRRPPPGER